MTLNTHFSVQSVSLEIVCFQSQCAALVESQLWPVREVQAGTTTCYGQVTSFGGQVEGPLFKVFKPSLTGLKCHVFYIFIHSSCLCDFYQRSFYRLCFVFVFWCFKSSIFPSEPFGSILGCGA